MTQQGYINVRCYYLNAFSSTLLSEADLLHATGKPKDYSGQTIDKFFHHSPYHQELIDTGNASISKEYDTDFGKCMVTCHHKQTKQLDLVLTGIIRHGKCFTLPLITPGADDDEDLIKASIEVMKLSLIHI